MCRSQMSLKSVSGSMSYSSFSIELSDSFNQAQLEKPSESVSRSATSDSATPWTVAHQAPLTMEFSRQEYWSGLPCPPPGDLPDPGIEPRSPTLQTDSLPLSHQGIPGRERGTPTKTCRVLFLVQARELSLSFTTVLQQSPWKWAIWSPLSSVDVFICTWF